MNSPSTGTPGVEGTKTVDTEARAHLVSANILEVPACSVHKLQHLSGSLRSRCDIDSFCGFEDDIYLSLEVLENESILKGLGKNAKWSAALSLI